VLGTVLLPGTGFVELALHAGSHVGCPVLEELTLQAPLVLPEQGSVQVQVAVASPDESGLRQVRVYSRHAELAEQPWLLHAEGRLSPAEAAASVAPAEWPPAHAEPLDVEDAYSVLLDQGFAYGPAFQGLTAAWRLGDELLADVVLPEQFHGDAERFGIHPALLDAAMHVALFAGPGPEDEPALPFAWTGVTLHATSASRLRVRLVQRDDRRLELTATDGEGRPVVSVGSVVGRPVSATPTGPAPGAPEGLFEVEWSGLASSGATRAPEVPLVLWEELSEERTVPGAVVFHCPVVDGDEVSGMHEITHRVLAVVQEWLAGDRYEDSSLVVVTRGAVATGPDEDVDVRQAPVWGLVRAAQAEAPGRFRLVDAGHGFALDDDPRSRALLTSALAAEEPESAIRAGALLVPRLVRAQAPAEPLSLPPLDGTVLVTGGTGGLGAVVARHLVVVHGVRSVLL
ncbi:polyketide synthase dehydratase domain-containing protein, partial [Streptomyces sp. NPDC006450]|uniref:polyketide synthase dehydratase domain-containing protein n=1 Tax=Streptomyces sp. NPDC006450 TaxID=3155458 RepID=UPI0033BEC907